MDWDDQVLAEAVAETREDSSFLSDDGSTAAAPMPMPGSFQLQATIEHPLVFLVLDTNVLLSRLHLIQSLHASATQGQFQMVLFFPYVVITELDYMKESKRTCTMPDGSRVTIESRARAAVRYSPRYGGEHCNCYNTQCVAVDGYKISSLPMTHS
eukprot:TRINITY_DN9213_c0_g1_i1.p2 TRINITY_DN9213_c0_g1~~TRINITY_DN9213_c0_g1_i1.p2  ORF type:complete len:164 (+),score=11.44 TRINITY_DN9213_c0_g1_i1:28-492(+)